MREIRYFGLNQWEEMREFMNDVHRSGSADNLAVRVDSKRLRYVVEWDEEPIDLENK